MKEECCNCKFIHIEDNFIGCRRYPPVVVVAEQYVDEIISLFPAPDENQWCGEYKELK